jgi:hypothetical protein
MILNDLSTKQPISNPYLLCAPDLMGIGRVRAPDDSLERVSKCERQ